MIQDIVVAHRPRRELMLGLILPSTGTRLSAEATFPAQLLDIRAALRHLHEHAAALGLDPRPAP